MPNLKDTYYFSHDSNASADHKILQMCSVYGAQGYGWYWMLVEKMREEPDYKLMVNGKHSVNAFALHMYCDPDTLQKFIDDCVSEFNLFNRENGHIWSDSLLRRMEMVEVKSEKARLSANIRWNRNANAEQPQSNSNAMKVNEMKVNDLFNMFWKEYPKKMSKGKAEKAFKKINPDETKLNEILSAIRNFKTSDQWSKDNGQFVPHPATWLNAKGWEDEINQTTGNKPNPRTLSGNYTRPEDL